MSLMVIGQVIATRSLLSIRSPKSFNNIASDVTIRSHASLVVPFLDFDHAFF